MKSVIEIEEKETIFKLTTELAKKSGMKKIKIHTLLLYSGAKKALKDLTILTNANTEILREKIEP